jgi:hypothetical protein
VAERSKARVLGGSLVGVEGSNSAGGMDICVVCCKEKQKAKFRTIKTMKYRVQESKKK